MSGSHDEVSQTISPPTETSPLLSPSRQPVDNGTIENADEQQSSQREGSNNVPLAEEPSTRKLATTMGSIWVGSFLAALDTTIIATLSGPISTSFHSFTLFSWLATGYLIANSALQPLSGRLTDIFSRRTGLVISNILFAAGNLICGLAQKEWVIIVGRVVSGMGGGGLHAISTFVASDLVPLRRRGLWQGLGNICFGLGSGLGGVFGGWINDVWGWRNAFLIQVPFVIVSAILVYLTVDIPVKKTQKSRIKRVDFLGAVTLVISLVLLLLGLNSGGNIVPWTHPLVLTTLPLSAVSLGMFVYVEACVAEEPVIPVRLMLHRTVWSACLTNWLMTMSVFALVYYIPIYYQILGSSTTQAGARLIPYSAGTALGSLGCGLFMRWTGRYYYLGIVVEGCLVLAGALIVWTFGRDLGEGWGYVYLAIEGFGYGGMLTITLLALISAVDHEHQAVITSASYAFRSTGSTIGITVASAVFQNLLKAQLWRRFGDQPGAGEVIGRIRDSIDEIRRLPPRWSEGVLDSYMVALRGVWGTVLGMSVLGAAVSLAMREHVLHKNLARK